MSCRCPELRVSAECLSFFPSARVIPLAPTCPTTSSLIRRQTAKLHAQFVSAPEPQPRFPSHRAKVNTTQARRGSSGTRKLPERHATVSPLPVRLERKDCWAELVGKEVKRREE
ncbi:hypothetical protein M441DRAFT_403629 [Trichoderma asperellum CBS 433.97]|uniref:Uncharacterized protein n=1 Tax=Trichoderma asperellum (strain ATCC 204424 / CBS 433.97 / NBRC 101777) TaxID=1042311 RepID=A0A2T3ZAB0_TRIA4|nr:hypothetical protein M441DRAFT_403629 [Trichoderma asperellum CBS 433.97]PTB41726.1 hypothetical protein M441DRAFT_403629 [Trichoderma asperellum CBS 433.97]